MNEWFWSIGGMILKKEAEVLGEEHYTASVVDEWMNMEHWWNDTERGSWSTGRKALYSISGRRMNEYWTLVEWYWQGKLKYWEKKFTASVVDEWMSMEHWWNDSDRANWNTGRRTLYSLGGSWINDYGALVGWYWQGETGLFGKTPVPVRYTNLARTGRGSTPYLRVEMPMTNRLSHGTAHL